MSEIIKNRYDFILLFDVKDGNPNGDPDAGNLPRVDAETGMGLVTDVCIKRKVRNYVQIVKNSQSPYEIYVKEKAVLGRAHVKAFSELGLALGEQGKFAIPENIYDKLVNYSLPDCISVKEEDEKYFLIVASDIDKQSFKEDIKELELNNDVKKILEKAVKDTKARKPKADEVEKGRKWMCYNYYDIRTFGGVLSLSSAPNCGQVRGPVQIVFGRSVDPIVVLEHSITRMAVATEAEAEKQSGDNRTMGRKFTVPYGLYCVHGFVSAHFAAQTGFNEEDLQLLWEALKNMFDHDHSAARGLMSTRKLIVFKHNSALGNAPAHKLFETVTIVRNDISKPARAFEDYTIMIDKNAIPNEVELIEKV